MYTTWPGGHAALKDEPGKREGAPAVAAGPPERPTLKMGAGEEPEVLVPRSGSRLRRRPSKSL